MITDYIQASSKELGNLMYSMVLSSYNGSIKEPDHIINATTVFVARRALEYNEIHDSFDEDQLSFYKNIIDEYNYMLAERLDGYEPIDKSKYNRDGIDYSKFIESTNLAPGDGVVWTGNELVPSGFRWLLKTDFENRVRTIVPEGAVFTDTIYDDSSIRAAIETRALLTGNPTIQFKASEFVEGGRTLEAKYWMKSDAPNIDKLNIDEDGNILNMITGLPIASTTKKGIAQFSPDAFDVSDGLVSIKSSFGDFWTRLQVPNLNLLTIDEDGNMSVPGNVTAFGTDDYLDTLLDNLPVATTTSLGIAQFNPDQFSVLNGNVTITKAGLDEAGLYAYLLDNKYATEAFVLNKNYITLAALNGYATESFVTNGFWSKANVPNLNLLTVDADGNLSVPGNITAFGSDGLLSQIIDALPIASTTSKGIAQFSSSQFSVVDGLVTVLDGVCGLDLDRLNAYMLAGDYTTKKFVTDQQYITLNALVGYATETWVRDKDYLIHSDLDGYATESFVNEGFWSKSGVPNLDLLTIDIDGNMSVPGNITAFGTDGLLSQVIDALPIASTTSLGIAQFAPSQFSVVDGVVTILDSVGNLDLNALNAYMLSGKYINELQLNDRVKTIVPLGALFTDTVFSKQYSELIGKPTIPSLTGYATEAWVLNKEYLTEHQDLSDYATMDWTNLNMWSKTTVPNLNKLNIDADGNLIVPGDVIAFGDSDYINNIVDSMPIASTTSKGIAQFDGGQFSVINGLVTITSEASGLDLDALNAYMVSGEYVNRTTLNNRVKTIVPVGAKFTDTVFSKQYSELIGKPTIPSLAGYATEAFVTGKNYLTTHQGLANYASKNHTHIGLSTNSWGGIRSQTSAGYIDFGPANGSHAHIYTDRDSFYFNKEMYVNGHRMYHTGYKPTYTDVGAAALGGSKTQKFNTNRLIIWRPNGQSNAIFTIPDTGNQLNLDVGLKTNGIISATSFNASLLNIKPTGTYFNEGMRIQLSSNKWSTIQFATNSTNSGTISGQWGIGRNPDANFQIKHNTGNEFVFKQNGEFSAISFKENGALLSDKYALNSNHVLTSLDQIASSGYLNMSVPFTSSSQYIEWWDSGIGWHKHRMGSLTITGYISVSGKVNANGGLAQDNNVILNGSDTWLRTTGATGWYSSTYGGGWYMTDATWVRTYGSKSIRTESNIYAGGTITAAKLDLSNRLIITNSTASDGGWNDCGIIINNTATATGEAALSFKNAGSAGTGSNYWITGLNQSNIFKWGYGSVFADDHIKMSLTNTGNLEVKGTLLSVGAITSNNRVICTRLGISTTSGAGGGIALYGNSFGTNAIPDYGLHFSQTASGSCGKHGSVQGDWATYFTLQGATNRGWIFQRGYSNVFSISGSGNVVASGTVTSTGNITAFSDMRLKDFNKPMTSILKSIDKLSTFYYYWKDKEKYGSDLHLGLSAQTVNELFPDFVNKADIWSLDYGKLGAVVAVKGLQEAKELLDNADKRISDLEERINKLEKLIRNVT